MEPIVELPLAARAAEPVNNATARLDREGIPGQAAPQAKAVPVRRGQEALAPVDGPVALAGYPRSAEAPQEPELIPPREALPIVAVPQALAAPEALVAFQALVAATEREA